MAAKKKRSVTIIGAVIGAIAVIIGAIITISPQVSTPKQTPTPPYVAKYDDPSGLFSIELPSIFKVAEREYSADYIDVIWRLDKEQINYDVPKKNYYYIAVYIYIFPLPDGVVLIVQGFFCKLDQVIPRGFMVRLS